ncbi:hypothetical protein E0L36_22490 [Streptomyces sp. AJS327]|uniref:hypothetical protein n=1 Tax=Streptomyces sp. AJS327 TaxID=2545265 RepID=UPI0015DD709D|nr:hypothetical protein [Streptomyces sp. AJS327]MBA0053544.1 hypothetical protein [Streptomyces sp. AJS327]
MDTITAQINASAELAAVDIEDAEGVVCAAGAPVLGTPAVFGVAAAVNGVLAVVYAGGLPIPG